MIKENKLWLGASIHSGDRKFYVPDSYSLNAAGCGIDEDGRKFIRVKGVRWFTNLDYAQRHEKLVLYKQYHGNEEMYPRYDNYDAINVDKTSDIPCDYFDNMGVPITYLDKHNPAEFDIVKFRKGDDGRDLEYSIPCLQTVNVERERAESNDRSVLQNYHQAKDITELWAFRSRSLTNTTRSSSKSSDLTDTSRIIQDSDIVSPSMDGKHTQEFLSRKECNGVMGVPITFLDKYNPEEFEILGMSASVKYDPQIVGIDFYGEKDGRPIVNGKNIYARIFVRRKNENYSKTN